MRRKTSGNTCARPISPTACSKTTPQSSTLASSHGAAFSTSSVASSPSPAVIGLLPVNHSEVWYKVEFSDPEIAAADNSPDRKTLLVWLDESALLNVVPAANPLARLRIIKHSILAVDFMF